MGGKSTFKPKLLFIYDQRYTDYWKDGLWKAVTLLENDFDVTWNNIILELPVNPDGFDFVLGRGDWGGIVDNTIQSLMPEKAGLYICGNVKEPHNPNFYDVLFYESDIQRQQLTHKNLIHCFGVNTEINKPIKTEKIWDYVSVGAFALWKRMDRLRWKSGNRLAIGEIQRENMSESLQIIHDLLGDNIMVSGMVDPYTLAKIYNASKVVYIPASVMGGGERAVQEARACGVKVEIEVDNPKLQWFLEQPIFDEHYCYEQLKKGLTL